MMLKLVMPQVDRMVQKGSIIKWHKREGDRVHYGDDLFDLNAIESHIRATKVRTVVGQEPVSELTEEEARARDLFLMPSMDCFICITSSDMGVLRKIYVSEGEIRDVGAILAVLTTGENEPIDESPEAFRQASVFRSVVSVIA